MSSRVNIQLMMKILAEKERREKERLKKAAEREKRANELIGALRAELAEENLAKLMASSTLEEIAPSVAVPQGAAGEAAPIEIPETLEARKGKIIEKCLSFHEELDKLYPLAGEDTRHLLAELTPAIDLDRLKLIMDNVRSDFAGKYTRLERARRLKDELEGFLEEPLAGEEGRLLSAKAKELMDRPFLETSDLKGVREKYYELKALQENAQEIRAAALEAQKFLESKGYRVLGPQGIEAGKVAFFETGDPDYRVECRADSKGKISFRQLKVAASEEEARASLSDYQKALDQKAGESWCQIQKDLAEKLSETGVSAELEVLARPGQAPLPQLIDPRKATKAVAARKDSPTERTVED
ncbi:MAG: hypothetical protein LBO66_00555 [Deltaproteobacteria bacterium]|jgi:hypothetical protein|nr:hypothetical protein [Deltaproteobacteria bacterium]